MVAGKRKRQDEYYSSNKRAKYSPYSFNVSHRFNRSKNPRRYMDKAPIYKSGEYVKSKRPVNSYLRQFTAENIQSQGRAIVIHESKNVERVANIVLDGSFYSTFATQITPNIVPTQGNGNGSVDTGDFQIHTVFNWSLQVLDAGHSITEALDLFKGPSHVVPSDELQYNQSLEYRIRNESARQSLTTDEQSIFRQGIENKKVVQKADDLVINRHSTLGFGSGTVAWVSGTGISQLHKIRQLARSVYMAPGDKIVLFIKPFDMTDVVQAQMTDAPSSIEGFLERQDATNRLQGTSRSNLIAIARNPNRLSAVSSQMTISFQSTQTSR